ncbi:DUF4158 domain-containing protein [Bacillus sp. FJAT-53711]|uniref:DUF4158 domain-containing protein n=1 Tax=Bacillus yunxiaonensis TaxID=3127665 RepID=A0ABU8G3D2_9BACI
MKRNWNLDELIDHFTIVSVEKDLIGNKTGASRLGLAVLLKYFQQKARFPIKKKEGEIVKLVEMTIGEIEF